MSLNLSHGKGLDVGDIGREIKDLPPLGETAETSRFDFRNWWPVELRDRPYELEIGSGKGTFLLQQAARHIPGGEVNYLGIEWAREFWRFAADRIRRHGLTNVRLLHADATEFVTWRCGDRVFRRVHIYFPDPWPKTRHHKRRSIQVPFLRQLHRVLTDDGLIRIVTDHDDYFTWIEQHAAQVADLFERQPFAPGSVEEGEIVGTNFERKYRREGRPFHAMTLKKI
ncbi:MAG: tRNA (guanosine(46)-N7)-methyltransferase TrmB [Phycisphaerales bacterium]